jgi:hypothetical protein
MKGFTGQDLEAFEINPVPLVELKVFLGEILANDSDELDRTEKAGSHRGVTG